jgi:hypothetical protein
MIGGSFKRSSQTRKDIPIGSQGSLVLGFEGGIGDVFPSSLHLYLVPLFSALIPVWSCFFFAVAARNVAVPVDFALGGKLAQTDFPG